MRDSENLPPDRLRVIIADDEAPARSILQEYLHSHEDIEVVGTCTNGFETVKLVNELRPDLLLLDIQMPKLDGFEVIELLDHRPKVVFVTAYDEYALRAFEVHAVDYLLKPFTAERFAQVLDHVRQVSGLAPSTPPLSSTVAAAATARPLMRVVVRQGDGVEVIPSKDIDYIEARDDSVLIATRGRKIEKPTTLQQIASSLDPAIFLRIHRSYILNIDRLTRLELYAKDSRIAILRDGTRIPVSRTGYLRLKERIGDT